VTGVKFIKYVIILAFMDLQVFAMSSIEEIKDILKENKYSQIRNRPTLVRGELEVSLFKPKETFPQPNKFGNFTDFNPSIFNSYIIISNRVKGIYLPKKLYTSQHLYQIEKIVENLKEPFIISTEFFSERIQQLVNKYNPKLKESNLHLTQ